jgi:hypothetical protein
MYARYAETQVRKALRDTRVVAISGPRQSGKTTLARRFTRQGLKFCTLDNQATLQAAKADPACAPIRPEVCERGRREGNQQEWERAKYCA